MENLNRISMRHQELKIAYLRDKISKIANGFFHITNGIPYVYVFYDPINAKASPKCKYRYKTGTAKGDYYSLQITEYQQLKSKLDELLKDWKAKYILPPRSISFPLQKARADRVTYDMFRIAKPYQNPKPITNPIPYKGEVLRSKNELINFKCIEGFGFNQKVEIKIDFNERDFFFPDSTFYVPEIDKVIMSNIDGALDNFNYVSKSYSETAMCITNGLVEGKDFITARIGNYKYIDAMQIDNLIRAAIEASIDDIIIPQ